MWHKKQTDKKKSSVETAPAQSWQAAAENDNRETTRGEGNSKHSSKPQPGPGYLFWRQGREISSIFDIVLWRSHLISSWVLCGWPAAINYHWQDLCTRKALALCFALRCLCVKLPPQRSQTELLSERSIFPVTACHHYCQPAIKKKISASVCFVGGSEVEEVPLTPCTQSALSFGEKKKNHDIPHIKQPFFIYLCVCVCWKHTYYEGRCQLKDDT